jgi:hypothetical protein
MSVVPCRDRALQCWSTVFLPVDASHDMMSINNNGARAGRYGQPWLGYLCTARAYLCVHAASCGNTSATGTTFISWHSDVMLEQTYARDHIGSARYKSKRGPSDNLQITVLRRSYECCVKRVRQRQHS